MVNYEAEVKQNWGTTNEYREYSEKTISYTKEKWQEINNGLMLIFLKFSECKQHGCSAESDKAQALVMELQNYITENYYTCTKEILTGLGSMYVADERFKESIDKQASGTAEFVASAIAIYCK